MKQQKDNYKCDLQNLSTNTLFSLYVASLIPLVLSLTFFGRLLGTFNLDNTDNVEGLADILIMHDSGLDSAVPINPYSYYSEIAYNIFRLQKNTLNERDAYYDEIYNINCDNVRERLSDDILLHSNLPYTGSKQKNFRHNAIYINNKNQKINPKHYDDIKDLWFTYDSYSLPEYTKSKSSNGKTKLILREYITTTALASSNDKGTLEDIVSTYIKNPNYYVLDTSNGLELFIGTNNSKVNLEKCDSYTLKKYFEPDPATVLGISIDNSLYYICKPLEDALDYVEYMFRDKYTSNHSNNNVRYNIKFGFPVAFKKVGRLSSELRYRSTAESDYHNSDKFNTVIPIYHNGSLIGFNGRIVDNWALMECITLLYKDNSESNPIEIVDIQDSHNFSVRNNYTRINVKGNTFQIVEQRNRNNINTEEIINVKDDIYYDVNRTVIGETVSGYRRYLYNSFNIVDLNEDIEGFSK